MPFLPQPSPFIRAWDRHQETQKSASDGWVEFMIEQKTKIFLVDFAILNVIIAMAVNGDYRLNFVNHIVMKI